jgi:hypothetical protein
MSYNKFVTFENVEVSGNVDIPFDELMEGVAGTFDVDRVLDLYQQFEPVNIVPDVLTWCAGNYQHCQLKCVGDLLDIIVEDSIDLEREVTLWLVRRMEQKLDMYRGVN